MDTRTFATFPVFSRVLIQPSLEDSTAPHVVGTVTGRFQHDNGEEYLMVLRDDGQLGGGTDGAWLCQLPQVEPLLLPTGAAVSVLCDDGDTIYTEVTQRLPDQPGQTELDLYYVAHEDLPVMYRNKLRMMRPPEPSEEPTPIPTPLPPLDAQPSRPVELDTWTFDMSRSLNDGARFPSNLPNDSDLRKQYPVGSVLFGQFPAAIVALAHHSWKGNNKHNPGLPLRDDRTKSNDDLECAMRHLMEGDYEAAFWRTGRLLQKTLEAEGAPVAPLATFGDNDGRAVV